jgi:outer membrane protein assembly factor BamB
VGDKLSATDIVTGKPAWTTAGGKSLESALPEGTATTVIGNEDVIVAQLDPPNRSGPVFQVIDAETGKFRKQFRIEDERALWRTISDDGTFFMVTDKSVAAFDLFNDRDSQPLWKRQDIRSRYPAATVYTPDGLLVVNGDNELLCLSAEGGEIRWPTQASGPLHLDLKSAGQRASYIRTLVDGDTVIYQSSQGVAAYFTYPCPPGEQIAWVANLRPPIPPLQFIQLSDPYAVVLGSGPVENTQRAVRLFLINKKGGKCSLDMAIRRAPNAEDAEGPLVRNWQLADNGIALEVNNEIRFFHGKQKQNP